MPSDTESNDARCVPEESIDLPLFDISGEPPELGLAIVKAAAQWGLLWIAGGISTEEHSRMPIQHAAEYPGFHCLYTSLYSPLQVFIESLEPLEVPLSGLLLRLHGMCKNSPELLIKDEHG